MQREPFEDWLATSTVPGGKDVGAGDGHGLAVTGRDRSARGGHAWGWLGTAQALPRLDVTDQGPDGARRHRQRTLEGAAAVPAAHRRLRPGMTRSADPAGGDPALILCRSKNREPSSTALSWRGGRKIVRSLRPPEVVPG